MERGTIVARHALLQRGLTHNNYELVLFLTTFPQLKCLSVYYWLILLLLLLILLLLLLLLVCRFDDRPIKSYSAYGPFLLCISF